MRKRKFILTLLVTALYVGLVAGESLHVLLVPHFFCAEHGEFSHSQHKHSSQVVAKRQLSNANLASIQQVDSSLDIEQPCHVLAARRKDLIFSSSEPGLHPFPENVIVRSTAPDILPARPFEAIYRLAPKTSPPVSS